MDRREAVRAWRTFSQSTVVEWAGSRRTWQEQIARGYADEEGLVQPYAFPRFAKTFLGFTVGETLAPERHGAEGKPDFTPADAVTHPFVFETKSTREEIALVGHDAQVRRYLELGKPRIRTVILTNLSGVRIFTLSEQGDVTEQSAINLRGLLIGDEERAASSADAQRFVEFLDRYSYQELDTAEKLQRVREAQEWNPLIEITDSEWISRRVDKVVGVLEADVRQAVQDGALTDTTRVLESERSGIIDELRTLDWRLGSDYDDVQTRSLEHYLNAADTTASGKALSQYIAHVAYYTATRLLLVRTWEDLGLLEPVLYDGGFDDWMTRFDDVVTDVVRHSFSRAEGRYRSLFARTNNYTWYEPGPDAYAEAIYELANTYLGQIESDVLGEVYERLLERIDRKLLGQYYTPRDVIALMWDLLDIPAVSPNAEAAGRLPRVLDIATGSGGFLVTGAARLRARYEDQKHAGAGLAEQHWMNALAEGLNGVEIQRFPAYLAELNLLIQVGRVLAQNSSLRIPPLGIITGDTLSLHNPVQLVEEDPGETPTDLLVNEQERRERALRIKDAVSDGFLFDMACGNPPYIGENTAASLITKTQERYPYWTEYAGHHMDYLYWFLILGVSKLREGGRFAFITTEYWFRAVGARPLRSYLAQRCQIDNVLLFRDLRLFPDAPGQHSMVIVGTRVAPPDGRVGDFRPTPTRPRVSIYDGPPPSQELRRRIIQSMRDGRSSYEVRSFQAARSPNTLQDASWAEVCMTEAQLQRRQRIRSAAASLAINPEQAMQTNADRMRRGYDEHLPAAALRDIGWPEHKAGIFVLDRQEFRALGRLTPQEASIIRAAVNTKDLYPYAAIPPRNGPVLLHLAAPEIPEDAAGEAALHLPFPDAMPNLERHLERFRPLLEHKVREYEEADKRPWWSIHRPKPKITARDHYGDTSWADYCVTVRWGGGERLVVGMAPAKSAPVSGLYALITEPHVPGAYACGVLNSTAVQELAETLPPGVIRSEDLIELGVPFLPDQVGAVSDATIELADLVRSMVLHHGPVFPLLPHAIKADVALPDVPHEAWLPTPGPLTEWGRLADVSWVEEVRLHGSRATAIRTVDVRHDLFGIVVIVEGQGGGAAVQLKEGDQRLADTLANCARGLGAQGGKLRELAELMVPTTATRLVKAYEDDSAALDSLIERYRVLRSNIDAIMDEAV